MFLGNYDSTWSFTLSSDITLACAEGGAIGFDGNCSTRNTASPFVAPISPDAAATLFDQHPPSDAALPGLADAGIKGGNGVEAVPGVTTGPASQTGAPVTSIETAPNGDVTSKTVTPEYHFEYAAGDSITYNKTETTETCVGTSACSTVAVTGPPTAETQDPTDPCVQHPETVGCLVAGTPPNTALPVDSRAVSVTPQSGWGADSSACPAPRSVTVLGVSATVDNTVLCGFMSGIRFAVLGAFGLAAAFIFVGGLRD